MNSILAAKMAPQMTSREIAELTEKEHRHVVRDIESMLDQLELPHDGYAQIWTHPQNRQEYRGYALPEELTLTLVAGYNARIRLRIINRWRELETKVPDLALPQTFAQALRLAAEQAETIEQQAAQLAAAKPALEFVDRYVDSTGSKGFRQVCKLLNAKEPEFRQFLSDAEIMYKLGGEWAPYAAHIDAGRFEVRTGTAEVSGHAFNSARFTPKGITWVAGEWAKYQIRGKA